MFRPCSTYVSTLSTEIGYVSIFSTYISTFSTKNRFCFGFVLDYVSTFSAEIGHVSSFLTNVSILSSNVSFFLTKIGHASTFSAYVSTFLTKIGYVSTLCLTQNCFSAACFSVAKLQSLDFQSRNISRAPRPGKWLNSVLKKVSSPANYSLHKATLLQTRLGWGDYRGKSRNWTFFWATITINYSPIDT